MVCSDHFDDDAFINSTKQRLKNDSVPTNWKMASNTESITEDFPPLLIHKPDRTYLENLTSLSPVPGTSRDESPPCQEINNYLNDITNLPYNYPKKNCEKKKQ